MSIITFPAPRRKHFGILFYRAPRTPSDICDAITNALDIANDVRSEKTGDRA